MSGRGIRRKRGTPVPAPVLRSTQGSVVFGGIRSSSRIRHRQQARRARRNSEGNHTGDQAQVRRKLSTRVPTDRDGRSKPLPMVEEAAEEGGSSSLNSELCARRVSRENIRK